MYVPIVPAQGKELYAAVCSLQAKAKRRKEWFASRHSRAIGVNLGANWRRRTDDCWEAANARYHPTILHPTAYR